MEIGIEIPVSPVTVWFDYACPHSYIGLEQLEELASSLAIETDRKPFLNRAEPAYEGGFGRDNTHRTAENGESAGARRRPLYKPGESTGTEPATNRSPSTLLVHAATAFAKERGLDVPFFRSASKEYWENGTNLGSLYSIRRIAASVGLRWNEMWDELESGRFHDLVLAQHQEAKVAGVVRTPSFQINGRLYSGSMSDKEIRESILAAS